jgi:hypothetical protein
VEEEGEGALAFGVSAKSRRTLSYSSMSMGDLAAIHETAKEQLVGERGADRVLDQARHRARRPVSGSKPFFRQPDAQTRR